MNLDPNTLRLAETYLTLAGRQLPATQYIEEIDAMRGSLDALASSYEKRKERKEREKWQDALSAMYSKTAAAPAGKKGLYKGKPSNPDTVKKTVDFQGVRIKVDRPKGFIMLGTNSAGKTWSRKYKVDYGFIPQALGGDGDGLDVFIGPNKNSSKTFWAIQRKPDGEFDEYKVFLGFDNRDAATACYRDHIPKKLLAGMSSMSIEMMKAMLGKHPNENLTKKASLEMYKQAIIERLVRLGATPVDEIPVLQKALQAITRTNDKVTLPRGVMRRRTPEQLDALENRVVRSYESGAVEPMRKTLQTGRLRSFVQSRPDPTKSWQNVFGLKRNAARLYQALEATAQDPAGRVGAATADFALPTLGVPVVSANYAKGTNLVDKALDAVIGRKAGPKAGKAIPEVWEL